jgi:cytidylate kinase
MIIAIDGPAGSGKSTVAKLIAKRLGFAYLDTGAMYRAVAACALATGIDLTEPLSTESQSAIISIAEMQPVEFFFEPGEPLPSRVLISSVDVTDVIRTPAVDQAVSPVSAEPGVRQALTIQQRLFGQLHNTVMEGRDIGTVVFPNAELKIFLTASTEERAQRRTIQNTASEGRSYDEEEYQKTLADIIRRDAYDSSRPVAPLIAASDSILLDSTGMSIEQVVDTVVSLARAQNESL